MMYSLAKGKKIPKAPEARAASLGYEAQLWQMANALRSSMDAAEYKHVVLGLLFDLISNIDFRQLSLCPGGHSSPSGRGDKGEGVAVYRDIPGFYESATLDEVHKHDYVFAPGRYVGAEAMNDDNEPFEENMARLFAQLCKQQAEAAKLDAAIAANLRELGYGD